MLCRVGVPGPGPGPRYGHVMALVGQRYLMAIGGNDGSHPNAFTYLTRLFAFFVNLLHVTFVLPPLNRKETFG